MRTVTAGEELRCSVRFQMFRIRKRIEVSSYATDRNKEQECLDLIYGHEYSELNHQGERKRLLHSRIVSGRSVNSILGLIYWGKVHEFFISKLPSEDKESIG
jgi:hypothetical protein